MFLLKNVSTVAGVAIILVATVAIFGSVFGATYYADLYAASILDAAGIISTK